MTTSKISLKKVVTKVLVSYSTKIWRTQNNLDSATAAIMQAIMECVPKEREIKTIGYLGEMPEIVARGHYFNECRELFLENIKGEE